MEDKYYRLLESLNKGLQEFKANPNAELINQVPSALFRLQLSGYVTNLSQRETAQNDLYPINLNDPHYLDKIAGYLAGDLDFYAQNYKKTDVVASILPNWYLLTAIDNTARVYSKNQEDFEEKNINPQLKAIQQHNENLINRLNQEILNAGSNLNPHQQALIRGKTAELREAIENTSLLPKQDPLVIKDLLAKKTEQVAADLKQQGVNLDETKTGEALGSFVGSAIPLIKYQSNINTNKEAYSQKIADEMAWQTTKTAFASAVASPVSPHVINLAAAQLAYEVSKKENASLLQPDFEKLIEEKAQEILKSPLFSDAVNPHQSTDNIASQIAKSLVVPLTQLKNNLQQQNADLNPDQHATSWSNTAAYNSVDYGQKNHDKAPPPSNVEIYLSHGMPAKWLVAALDVRSGEHLLKWTIKGGPIKAVVNAAASVVGSSYLSGSLQEYVIKEVILGDKGNPGTYESYYSKIYFKFSQKPLSNLTAEEYYEFKEAEKALVLIRGLRQNLPLMEKQKLRKFFFQKGLLAFEIIHPIQFLKTRLSQRVSSFKGLLGLVSVDVVWGMAQHPEYALYYLSQYPKMFVSLGWKKLGLLTGLYKIEGAPMFKHYLFAPTDTLKKHLRFALHKGFQKIASKLFKESSRAAIGAFVASFTAGLGLAFGILQKLYAPLKKIAQLAGLWVFGLILQFGLPGLIGALIGGLAGFVAGAILGAKLGIFLLGWIPALGPIAGAIIGFVVGGIIGWASGTVFGAYLGHFVAEAVAVASHALSITLGPALSLVGQDLAVFAAKIGFISLTAVSGLTIYAVWVTSSAFFSPGTYIAGSKYFNLTKDAQVGGLKNPNGVPNNLIGQKVKYDLSLNSLSGKLSDVSVIDRTTIVNKDGVKEFTEKFLAEIDGDQIVFKNKAPTEWNSGNDPSLKNIDEGGSWNKTYGFPLTNTFIDSYVVNTVTVNAKVQTTDSAGNPVEASETKSVARSFKIGNPPKLPSAINAKLIIDSLLVNYGEKITTANLGQDKGKKLSRLLKDATIRELLKSVGDFSVLQCVGFVQAVLAESNQPSIPFVKKASDLFGQSNDHYIWHSSSELKSLKPGDIFVSKKVYGENNSGHAAIVYETTADNGFVLAEALGDSASGGAISYSNFYPFEKYYTDPDIGFLTLK